MILERFELSKTLFDCNLHIFMLFLGYFMFIIIIIILIPKYLSSGF